MLAKNKHFQVAGYKATASELDVPMLDTEGFKTPDGPTQVHSELVTGVPVPPTVLLLASSSYHWGCLVESKWPSWGGLGSMGQILSLLAPPGVAYLGVLCRDLLLGVL